jgi:hypothetical protein
MTIYLDAAAAQSLNELLKLPPFGGIRHVVAGEGISLAELIDWITVAINTHSR